MWELISQQFCLCGGLCGEQQQKTKPLSWCLRISLYICVYSADSCSAVIYLWLHSITSSSSSVRVEVSETFSLLLLVLPAETNIDTIWHLYSHNAALNCIKVKSLTSSHIMRPVWPGGLGFDTFVSWGWCWSKDHVAIQIWREKMSWEQFQHDTKQLHKEMIVPVWCRTWQVCTEPWTGLSRTWSAEQHGLIVTSSGHN